MDATGPATQRSTAESSFLVVARGHRDLFEQIKDAVGDLVWLRVIEDRRQDPVLLPREGREGRIYLDA